MRDRERSCKGCAVSCKLLRRQTGVAKGKGKGKDKDEDKDKGKDTIIDSEPIQASKRPKNA